MELTTANHEDIRLTELTSILKETAEYSARAEEFLAKANSEQLNALRNAYLEDKTLKTFGKFVELAGIDIHAEKERFLLNYRSPATRDAYRRAIQRLETYTAGIGKNPLALTFAEADDFILSISNNTQKKFSAETERASASVRRDIAAVSSFFTFLERRHEAVRNPFKGTKARPKQKSVRQEQYPTDKEIETILNNVPEHLKAAIIIMSYRGLRVGALPAMRIKENTFQTESKGKEVKGTFSIAILEAIKKAKLNKEKPFAYLLEKLENGKARKSTPEQCLKMQIQSHMKKLYKEGKISAVFSAHDFRHFFAVHEYMKDKDIYRVSKLLNHSNIAITETYLRGLNINL